MKEYSYINKLLIGVIALILYIGIYFGINFNEKYYVLLILIIPIGLIIMKNRDKIKKEKTFQKIRKNWGKKIKRNRDYKKLNDFFELTKKNNNKEFLINDQVWTDLNMNQMFSEIDRTVTNCGEKILYKILRTLKLDKKTLIERNELIKHFINNKDNRENIINILNEIEWKKDDDSVFLLYNEINYTKNLKILSNIMRLVAILSLPLIKFIGLKYLFVTVLIFAINSYIISKSHKQLVEFRPSMKILRNMVIAANSLSNIKDPIIEKYVDKLKENVDKCQAIIKDTNTLFVAESDPLGLAIYLKTFFLFEVNSFYKTSQNINKYRNELKEIYNTIGEIDALISIASYRSGLEYFIEPEILDEGKKLYVEDIVHPIIENPVSNSISIDESLLVTGSNMSGKSTFLRTLGINTLLAQTIYVCHAKRYTGSLFKIMTSISRNDDINEGKSYFLREAELLLDMIDNLDDVPSLIIIDEIFRGTNTIERIDASSKILSYFSNENSLVVVATHDLELNELVDNTFESYHFSEKVGQMGLEFDYKLKKGIVKSGNAIKILKFLGYPEDITVNL